MGERIWEGRRMGMETESGRDGEMEARREMGGGAKEEWRVVGRE